MRSTLLYILLTIVTTFSAYGQSEDTNETLHLKGELGGKYPITMTLTIDWNSDWQNVWGDYYYYSNSDNRLELRGYLRGDEIILSEYTKKGEATGEFTINYNNLKGEWSSGERTLAVELGAINSKIMKPKSRNYIYITDQAIIRDGLSEALRYADFNRSHYQDLIIELPSNIALLKSAKGTQVIESEQITRDGNHRDAIYRVDGEVANGTYLWYTKEELKPYKNHDFLQVTFSNGTKDPISIGCSIDNSTKELIVTGIEKDIFDSLGGYYIHTIFNDHYGDNVVGAVEYYSLRGYTPAEGMIFHWRVSEIAPHPHVISHIEEYDPIEAKSLWKFYQSSDLDYQRLSYYTALRGSKLPSATWETYFRFGYPQSSSDDGEELLINAYRPEGVSPYIHMSNHYKCDFSSQSPNTPLALSERLIIVGNGDSYNELHEVEIPLRIYADSLNYQHIVREDLEPIYLVVNSFRDGQAVASEYYSLIDSDELFVKFYNSNSQHDRTAIYKPKEQEFKYIYIPHTEGNLSIREVKGDELKESLDAKNLNEELVVDSDCYELSDTTLILQHPQGTITLKNEVYYYDNEDSESVVNYLGYSKSLKGQFIEKYGNIYLIPDSEHSTHPYAYNVTINTRNGLIASGVMESDGAMVSRVVDGQSQTLGYIWNISIESSRWISATELLIKDYNSDSYYIVGVGELSGEPLESFEAYSLEIIDMIPEY